VLRDLKSGAHGVASLRSYYLELLEEKQNPHTSPTRPVTVERHAKEVNRYEQDTSLEKFTAISRQVSPDSPPDVSAGYCQITLVAESGKPRTQTGKHNVS
jgi:hypothetical protein